MAARDGFRSLLLSCVVAAIAGVPPQQAEHEKRAGPNLPPEGELVTIHGAGFDANCKENHLIVEGTMAAAPLQHCTSSSVSFKVPRHSVSGELEVMTDRGLGVFGSALEDCDGIPREAVTWSSEHANHR